MSLFYISISGKSVKRLRYNSEPKWEETKSVPESVVVAVSELRAGKGAEQKRAANVPLFFGTRQAEARSVGGVVVI